MNSARDIFFWLVLPIGGAFLIRIVGGHVVDRLFRPTPRPFPPVEQLYDRTEDAELEALWALPAFGVTQDGGQR